MYRPLELPKFGSTSCATRVPCPEQLRICGHSSDRMCLLLLHLPGLCLTGVGPGPRGDHDPHAEGGPGGTYFQPARSCPVLAVTQLGSDHSHVESCKHICQSRLMLMCPQSYPEGSGGWLRGFGNLHQIKCRRNQTFSPDLLTIYKPLSSFCYQQQMSSSEKQFSSKLSGWIWPGLLPAHGTCFSSPFPTRGGASEML